MRADCNKSLISLIRGCVMIWVLMLLVVAARAAESTNEIRIVEIQGSVEVSPAGATTWVLTQTNQVLNAYDRLRTSTNSRVALRWSDRSVVSFGASTELEILPPHAQDAQSGLRLTKGIISFFHRDKPGRIRVLTRGAVAGIEGTEFVLQVASANGDEKATLSVIDGKVRLANDQGEVVVTTGEQAIAESGKAPVRTAGFVANNVLQWSFYYPAVIDLADLPLTAEEQNALAESLKAYREGDLQAALARYPGSRSGVSDAERVYHAALLLSVGQVIETENELASLPAGDATARPQRLANALRQLIAAVKRDPHSVIADPQLSSELLASSYYEQSRAVREVSLANALDLARRAVAQSPEFGFGWARVAELEVAFGRTRQATEALERSLELSPRNAQAIALEGFLLAARNRPREAMESFDRALAVDSGLANAWLGRGLCLIHGGNIPEGRESLLVAAALEPQRAELRSYLAKAEAVTGDRKAARSELQLAKRLDPNDPTPWLYSALLNQQDNQINEAVKDLEKSQELNDNRKVYRSQLLLDQDRAVRSANLAAIYQDAGMLDVALREASRAVNDDYANYSAHLFLANSYDALRDPNLFNLRYETAAQSEYLLVNLLAPASAGVLSPAVSRQEYYRLFERDHLGVASITEYLSRGAWTESGVQYGVFGNFSYDVGAFYKSDPGQRDNSDLEARSLSLTLKYEFTPHDITYLRVEHANLSGGFLGQSYDLTNSNPTYRFEEKQEPNIFFGYNHEWQPGVHTLFLVSRMNDTFSFTNARQGTLLAVRPDIDPVLNPGVTELIAFHALGMHQQFEGRLNVYSGEVQQLWQQPQHDTIVGTRVQYGNFHTLNRQVEPSSFAFYFPEPPDPAALQDVSSMFKRVSVYAYHQWQILEPVLLTGGVVYDWLAFPENFRYAPISDAEETKDQISPKVGLIWTPLADTTVRFAYTRSLTGASLDQSIQLEPSQVAGFVQSFRSVIPESVAGGNAGAEIETFGLSLEQKFPTRTYLGVSGEILNSKIHRTLGAFDALVDQLFDFAVPSSIRQHLDYQEQSLQFTANQLLGENWSVGARYRVSQAVFKSDFVGVTDLPLSTLSARQRLESVLYQVDLFGIYNHRSGFFAGVDAHWYSQDNEGYIPAQPGDEFWQLNVFAGYRFLQRRAEARIGLLNITDQNYRLSPLNLYNELPRERTLAVQLQVNF